MQARVALRAGCCPTREKPGNSCRQALPKATSRKGAGVVVEGSHSSILVPLSKAVSGARVNTSVPLHWLGTLWPLAWLRPQGRGTSTEVNIPWCRGRCTEQGGTGYTVGLCHYLSPEASPIPTEPQIPSCEMRGLD